MSRKYAEKKRYRIIGKKHTRKQQHKLTKMLSCLPYRSIYLAYLELLNFHENKTIVDILGVVDYSKCIYAKQLGWK